MSRKAADTGGHHRMLYGCIVTVTTTIVLLLVLDQFPGASAKSPGTCRVGELRCQNGDLCVPREKVCNGERDCDDGLDEYVCKFRRGLYSKNGPKKGAVFQCQFGGVIPLSRLCDGNVNCLDGSDESEICENNSCLPGQFRCKYGGCIADWQMCNGRATCPDGSDETAEVCEHFKCKETEFRCRYGGCVRRSQICDFKKHCADGSDESEFLCLITRAKMLTQWEKDEVESANAKDKRKKSQQNSGKSPNSVLPSPLFSRLTPAPPSTTIEPNMVSNDQVINHPTSKTDTESTNSTLGQSAIDGSNKRPQSESGNPEQVPSSDGNNNKDVIGKPDSEQADKTSSENMTTPSSTTIIPTTTTSLGSTEVPSTSTTTAQPTVTCVLPEIPDNSDAVVSHCMFDGKVCDENMRSVSVGTQIHYECDAGYSLYGAPIISCQDDGKWSLTPPICEVILDVRFGLGSVIPKDFRPRCPSINPTKGSAVECLDPSDLAVKSCSELQKPGVEARLSCKAYYRPAGDLPVHYEKCGDDGHWSPGSYQQYGCVPDCGLSEVPKTPFIVNGKSIKRGQWPWHVGVYVEHKGDLTYICGGALITENAILTSAHCVTRHGSVLDPSKFRVFLGKQTIALPDSDPFVQSRHISKIFVDDAFNFRSLDSDIAIMALETPAVLSYFVRPVCYPQMSNSFLEEYQLAQGNMGTVLGWGTTENHTLSHELRMIELPVVSQQGCVEAYRDFFASMTRSTNYCAGYLNGTSLCNGDSGGGQYFKAIVKGATRWYIQGLVSYGVPKEGSKQCSSSHYTVFTRVGRYADWIVRTLSRESLI